MKKLWETNYKQNISIEEYCFKADTALDTQLIAYDVLGSIAHAKMLATIGIITIKEFQKLHACLLEILELAQKGTFVVGPQDEDVHTKVEAYLIEQLGETGKKIHTGRSRNDQVLVDLRLFAKDQLFTVAEAGIELADAFLHFAKEYEFVPMPGYTHMQKAMPSSVGLWAASFTESLLDDLSLLQASFILNDQSPLGSGAAYGVSLPLDREFVAKELGFAKVQNNVLYAQVSRGKVQLAIMHALSQMMLTLSRFAQDLLLFTTSEFNFFTVPQEFCTGSSIMPQKKNLDVMEILRAKTYTVLSQEHLVSEITAGLPSGYNADFGQTKQPFMAALETVERSLAVVALLVRGMKPNTEILTKSCTPELFATHAAYQLVKKGMPFRDAHHTITQSLDTLPQFDVKEVLKETDHSGAPGNLMLDDVELDSKNQKKWWLYQKETFTKAMSQLKGGEGDEDAN